MVCRFAASPHYRRQHSGVSGMSRLQEGSIELLRHLGDQLGMNV